MAAKRSRISLPMALLLTGSLLGVAGTAAAVRWSVDDRPATAAPASPPPASPAPAPIPLAVLTWNVCAKAEWRCPAGGQHRRLAAAVGEAARARSADVLLLQEVCADLLPALESSLGAGWTVYFRQATTASVRRGTRATRPATCGADGVRYGQAVAVRTPSAGGDSGVSPVQGSWLVQLPSPAPKGRKWVDQRLAVCVRLRSPRLQVCGTHLSTSDQDPGGEIRAAQAARLAAEARKGRELGYATIVGGDFNTTPATTVTGGRQLILQPLYDEGVDCDPRRKQATFGDVKIDYVFSGPGIEPLGCEAIPTRLSDHRMLAAHYHLHSEPTGA